jgi:hypothetical protein
LWGGLEACGRMASGLQKRVDDVDNPLQDDILPAWRCAQALSDPLSAFSD